MNSIAIWWDVKRDSTLVPEVHLDINIWLTKKHVNNYIEFGLKINNFSQIANLWIYLPYKIDKNDFTDKINNLISETKLTNAIFNENMKVENSEGKFHKVTYPDNSPNSIFYYCQLNENNDIDIQDFTDNSCVGSKLKINFSNIERQDPENIYLRFRIKKISNIYKKAHENNFIIDGLFKVVCFIELNINNIRKLPFDIVDNISSKVEFQSMNLFLMTDDSTNFIFKSRPIHNSRILENHIWDKYLENNHENEKIIAYHWKNKESFKHYSLFSKIYYTDKNWIILIIAILTVFVLGTIGSIVGNYATKKYFNGFSKYNSKIITNTDKKVIINGINDIEGKGDKK